MKCLIFTSLWAAATSSALAADADAFLPASSLSLDRGTVQVEAPWLGAEGWSGGLHTSSATNLAVFHYEDGEETPILAQVSRLDFHGGYTLGTKGRIDAFLPIYMRADAPWAQTSGAAFGDLRVQGTLPVYADDLVHIAVIPRISLPSGKNAAYVGKAVAAGVSGAAGGTFSIEGANAIEWVANAGLHLTPADEIEGRTIGSTFDLSGGATYQVQPRVKVGADLLLSLGLASGLTGVGNTFSQGNVFARITTDSGLGITAGIGTGLIGGIGAPDTRAFAAFTFGHGEQDRDHDGIPDPNDLCPLDPEDHDQFDDNDGCPEADNDNDGIMDAIDQCPLQAEDTDGFTDDDGCADPDNDGDSLLDGDDACPTVAGVPALKGCPDSDRDGLTDSEDQCPAVAGTPDTQGCPDRDNDKVRDEKDKCPDEAGPLDEDPRLSDGCPKRVYVAATEVRITEKVFFETNAARIKSQSFELLDTVAATLTKYPWIREIEVGGHTDDVGDDAKNLKLSQARCESVRKYLLEHGVDGSRLTAVGYGEAKPIDTNRTDAGRSNNRRVEFRILQKGEPAKNEEPNP